MLSLEEEKRLVLLRAAREVADRPRKSRVLDHILDRGYLTLDDDDLAVMMNRDEETWRNDLAFVRQHLVDLGYLDGSKRDWWKITENGEKYLASLLKHADPTRLRKATAASLVP